MAEREAVKKLTQVQKNYLVKRINNIASAKIGKLGGTANYGYTVRPMLVNKHSIGQDVLMAIAKGTVKLRNRADVVADLKSLEKFNAAINEKNRADYEAKQKRITSVRDEADKLKDSVMLTSQLARELLDKFEKKEF